MRNARCKFLSHTRDRVREEEERVSWGREKKARDGKIYVAHMRGRSYVQNNSSIPQERGRMRKEGEKGSPPPPYACTRGEKRKKTISLTHADVCGERRKKKLEERERENGESKKEREME